MGLKDVPAGMKDALYISKRRKIETDYCIGISTKLTLKICFVLDTKTIKPPSRVAFLFFRRANRTAEFITELIIV